MSTNSGFYTSTSTKNETGATASSQIANQDNDDQGALLVTKAAASASSAPYASSSKNLSIIVADSALVSEKSSSSSKDETNSNAQLVPLSSLSRSSLVQESTSFLSPYDGIGWLDRANLPQMYHSMSSICSDDDPWKASSIGIKCISYQPVGYVFLTRRVLDLNVTDGQRKIEVVYNYSKKYRSKIKIPSIGSSMQNCSFCDTITLDFDPGSTLLDLVMEVQIITQGATLERHLKVSTMPSKDHAEEREIYDEKQIVKRFGEPETAAQGEEDEEYNEVTTIRSNYDYKYLKTTTLHINDDAVSCNQKDNFELPKSHCHLEKLDELDEEPAETCDTQKITIRTIIKSDFNSTKNAGYDSTPNVGQVEDELGFDSRRLFDSDRSRKCKSMSPSPSYTFITPLSQSSSRCNYNSNSKRGLSPEESIRKSISSRSIVTTVEFSPPVPNIVESFDIENEEKEKKKFFDEFNKLYETDSQYDETSSTQNFSTDDEMATAQAAAFSTVETTALDGDLKLAESPREIEISFKLNDQEKERFQTVSHSNQVSETIELADNKITIDAAKEAANTKLETISKSNLTVQKEETTNKVESYVISMESSIKPIEVSNSQVNESEKQTTEAIGDAEPSDEGLQQQRLAHDKKSINTDETYHLDNLVYEMRLTKSCETANSIDYDHESNYAQENKQNLAMIIKKDRLTELAEEAINYANNSFNQENAEIKTKEITNASANAMNKEEEDSQMQESGEQVDAVREPSGALTGSDESEKARMTSQDAESSSKQDAVAQLQEDKSDSQPKPESSLVSSNSEGQDAFQSENEIVRIISESVTIEYNEILTKVEYETVETKRKQSVQIQETNTSQDANTQLIADSASVVVGHEDESRAEDMSTSEDTASVETVIRANLRTQETLEESEVDELNQTVDSIGSADSDFTFEESSVDVSGDVLAIQEPFTPKDSTQSQPASEYRELEEESNVLTKHQQETVQEVESGANSAQCNQIEPSNLENYENASAEVFGAKLEEESTNQVTTTEELVEVSTVEEADIEAIVKAIEDVTAVNNQTSSTDTDVEVSEGIDNLRNVMKSVLETANISNSPVKENDQDSTLTQIVEQASELVNPKIIKKVAEIYRGSNDSAESQLELASTDQPTSLELSNLVQVVKDLQHADESLVESESDIEQSSQIEPTFSAQENTVEENVVQIEDELQVVETNVVTSETGAISQQGEEVEHKATEQTQLEKDEMVPEEFQVDSTNLVQEAVITELSDTTAADLEVNHLIEEVPAISHEVVEAETTIEKSNLTQPQYNSEIVTRTETLTTTIDTTTENDAIEEAISEAPVINELSEVSQHESQAIADQFLEDSRQQHEQVPSQSQLTRDVQELSSQEHTESVTQEAGSELEQNAKIEPSVMVSSIESGEEQIIIESRVAKEKDVTSDLGSSFEQSIANLPDTSFSTDQSDNFSSILTNSVISVQSSAEDLLDTEKRSDETSTTHFASIANVDKQSEEISTTQLENSNSTQAEVEAKDQRITEFLEAIVDKVRPENSSSLVNTDDFNSKTENISETSVNSLKSEAERMLTFETNIIDAALDSIINKTPEEKDSSEKFLQSELIQKAKNVLTDLIESTLVQAPDSEIFANESAQTSDVDAPEDSDKESDQPAVKSEKISEEPVNDVQNQNVREDINSDDNSSLESELITEIKTITQLISAVNKETTPDLGLSTDDKQDLEIVEAETSKQESNNAAALPDEKSNQDGAFESADANQVDSKALDQVVLEQEVIYDVVKEISLLNSDETDMELEPRIEEPEDDAAVDNFFSTITELISKQEQQSVLHSSSESDATQESCFLDEDKADILEESFDSTADQGAPKSKGYDAYDDLDELIKETNSKQGSKIVSGKASSGQTRSQDFGVPQNSTLSGSSQFSSENPSLNKKDPSMENISGAEDLKMNLKDSSLDEICKDFESERWQDQNVSLGSLENIEVPDDLNHSETSSEGHGSEMLEAESTTSITQTKSTVIEQMSEQFEEPQVNDQLKLEPAVEPIKDLALGIDEHLDVSNQLDEIVKLAQELVTSDNINQIVAEIRQATEQALNEIHTEFDSDNAEDASEILPEDESLLIPTRNTLSQEQEQEFIFNKAVIEEHQPRTEFDSSSEQESPVILAQEQATQEVEEITSDADPEIAETSTDLSTESADSVVMIKTADESLLRQVTEEEIFSMVEDQAAVVEHVSSSFTQETAEEIVNIETTTSIREPIESHLPENTQQPEHEIKVEEIATTQEPSIESVLSTSDNRDESSTQSDEQTQIITVQVPEDKSMPYEEELAESREVVEETTTQPSTNITDHNEENLDQQLSLNTTTQPREESQLSETDEELIQTTVEVTSESVAQETLISNESDSAELAAIADITEEPEIREESRADTTSLEQDEALTTESENTTALNLEMNGLVEDVPTIPLDVEPTTLIQPQEGTEIVTTETTNTITEHNIIEIPAENDLSEVSEQQVVEERSNEQQIINIVDESREIVDQLQEDAQQIQQVTQEEPAPSQIELTTSVQELPTQEEINTAIEEQAESITTEESAPTESDKAQTTEQLSENTQQAEQEIQKEPETSRPESELEISTQSQLFSGQQTATGDFGEDQAIAEPQETREKEVTSDFESSFEQSIMNAHETSSILDGLSELKISVNSDHLDDSAIHSISSYTENLQSRVDLREENEVQRSGSLLQEKLPEASTHVPQIPTQVLQQQQSTQEEIQYESQTNVGSSQIQAETVQDHVSPKIYDVSNSEDAVDEEFNTKMESAYLQRSIEDDTPSLNQVQIPNKDEEEADEQEFINKFADNEDKSKSLEDTSAILDQSKYLAVLDSDEISIPLNVKNSTQTPQKTEGETINLDAPSMNIASSLQEWNFLDNQAPVKIEALPISETDTESLYSEITSERHQSARDDENERSAETSTISFSNILSAFALPKAPTPPNADQDQWDNFTQFGFIDFSKEEDSTEREDRITGLERLEQVETVSSSIMPETCDDLARFDIYKPWTNELSEFESAVQKAKHAEEFDAYNNDFPVAESASAEQEQTVGEENLSAENARSLVSIIRSVQLPTVFSARGEQNTVADENNQTPSTFDFIEFNPKQKLEDQTSDVEVFKQDVVLQASSESNKAQLKADQDPAAFDAYAPWTNEYNNFQEKAKNTVYAEEFDAFNNEFPAALTSVEEAPTEETRALQVTLPDIRQLIRYLPRLPAIREANEPDQVQETAQSAFSFIEFNKEQESVPTAEAAYDNHDNEAQILSLNQAREHADVLAAFDKYSAWSNNNLNYADEIKRVKHTEEFDAYNNEFPVASTETEIIQNEEAQSAATQSSLNLTSIIGLIRLPHATARENSGVEDSQVLEEGSESTLFDFIDFNPNATYDAKPIVIEEINEMPSIRDSAVFDQTSPWTNEYNNYFEKVKTTTHSAEFDAFNNEFPVIETNTVDNPEEVSQESSGSAINLASIIRSVQLPIFAARENQVAEISSETQMPSNFDFIEFNPKQQLEDQLGDDEVFREDVALLASSETNKVQLKADKDPAAFDTYAPWTNDYNNYQEKAKKTKYAEEFDAFNAEFPPASDQLEESNLDANPDLENSRTLTNIISSVRLPTLFSARQDPAIENNAAEQSSTFDYIEFSSKQQEDVSSDEAPISQVEPVIKLDPAQLKLDTSGDMATFDAFSQWNNELTQYQSSAKKSKFNEEFDPFNNNFEVNQSLNETEELVTSAETPSQSVFSNIISKIRASASTKINEQAKSNFTYLEFEPKNDQIQASEKSDSGVQQLESIDYSQYKLVPLPAQQEIAFNSLFSKSDNPADFITNKLKPDYFKVERLTEDELRLRSAKADKDPAAFDAYAPWTNEYNNYKDKAKNTAHAEEFDAFNNDFSIVAPKEPRDLAEEQRQRATAGNQTNLFSFFRLPTFPFPSIIPRNSNTQEIQAESSDFEHIVFDSPQQAVPREHTVEEKVVVKTSRDPAVFDANLPWTNEYSGYEATIRKSKHAAEFDAYNNEFPVAESVEQQQTAQEDASTSENARSTMSIFRFVRLPIFSARYNQAAEPVLESGVPSTFDFIEFNPKQQLEDQTDDDEVFKQDAVLSAGSENKKVQVKVDKDPAAFDAYVPWTNDYNNYQDKAKRNKHAEEFDPFNSEFPIVTEARKNENELSLDDPRRIFTVTNLFRAIGRSLRTRQPPTDRADRIEESDNQETQSKSIDVLTLENNNNSRLNRLLSDFKLRDLVDFNSFYQDAFVRPTFCVDNSGVSRFYMEPSSPLFNNFSLIDLVRFQNLTKIKPYFDDFATFPNQYYEYTRYHLITNPDKYDYYKSITRSGQPFFFVHDHHKVLEDREENNRPSTNLLGYAIISMGALSLLSYTFV